MKEQLIKCLIRTENWDTVSRADGIRALVAEWVRGLVVDVTTSVDEDDAIVLWNDDDVVQRSEGAEQMRAAVLALLEEA